MKTKLQPPAYFFASLLLLVGLHFFFPLTRIIGSPYRYLGIVLILFGVFLNLWTDSLFKKHKTTVKPYETPTYLEASGPFRISRHPMYLGMVSILVGIAVALGSLVPFVVPILFVIITEVMFIRYEEENLEQAFKEEYLNYKKKVRRWI
jgi:protein-S-isoprenylcysteine O-methyltransferase Ste14